MLADQPNVEKERRHKMNKIRLRCAYIFAGNLHYYLLSPGSLQQLKLNFIKHHTGFFYIIFTGEINPNSEFPIAVHPSGSECEDEEERVDWWLVVGCVIKAEPVGRKLLSASSDLSHIKLQKYIYNQKRKNGRVNHGLNS